MNLRQSLAIGRTDVPIIEQTIGDFFDAMVARQPDHEALVSAHEGVALTYRELQAEATRLASALLGLGLATGDRVGIWSHNNAAWLLMQIATAKAGLILVNINPAYRTSELEYALNKVDCKALVTMACFKSSDYHGMLAELAPELATAVPGDLHAARLPALRAIAWIDGAHDGARDGAHRGADHVPNDGAHDGANGGANGGANDVANDGAHDGANSGAREVPGTMRFSALLAGGSYDDPRVAAAQAALRADDAINIQFTSGTTGFPKGATLTHRNILNNGFFIGECMTLTPADRLCIPVPLYHCFGMVLGNLACLTHGSTIVFPNDGFDPLTVLQTVERERCTGLHGVPTMFIAELDHPRFAEFDLSTLRTGIMAGSPCPIEVMKRVVDRMHLSEITIAYGMTETSPVSCQSSTDTPLDKRVSTVGTVQPHLVVKIIDPATGDVVAPGVTGELCTQGYSVMKGYWGDDARTREAIDDDGFMHTGDLATMDADGYVNIVGRIKDLVIRGGENVYPREIEEYLYRHPAVQDVQVIGVPDARYGEELCAWVVVKPGQAVSEDEVRAFCQGRIARYKIPRYVRFVDAFPMTVTGKIQKFRMREATIEALGLVEAKTA